MQTSNVAFGFYFRSLAGSFGSIRRREAAKGGEDLKEPKFLRLFVVAKAKVSGSVERQ